VEITQRHLLILKSVELFSGLDEADMEVLLDCLGAEIRTVEKDDIVLLAGDTPKQVGLVLAGQLHITRDDYEGNRSLIAVVAPGELYAEALCCAGVSESPVTVTADTQATVMLLSFSRTLDLCSKVCAFHRKLIENMLRLVANKNLLLQDRMEIISMKLVRAKVLHYLESFVPRQGRTVTIPFNREKMAAFLCVERSALSHELARMKKDGLIDYRKNKFILRYIQ